MYSFPSSSSPQQYEWALTLSLLVRHRQGTSVEESNLIKLVTVRRIPEYFFLGLYQKYKTYLSPKSLTAFFQTEVGENRNPDAGGL